MADLDLSKFSDADLEALKGTDVSKLSDAGLEELRSQRTPAAKPRPLLEDIANTGKAAALTLAGPYVHGLGNVADLLTGTPPGPESHASKAMEAVTPEALKMHAPEPGAEIDPATAAAEPELQALPGMQRLKEAVGNAIPGKVKQVGELALDVTGLRRATGAVARGASEVADTAANAAIRPSAVQAENIASNPAIARARAAGYQLTGNDIRRAVPSAPDAELPGSTRQAVGGTSAVDTIRRNNAAHATETMADDVGLTNTRAIDPEEMNLRVQQEAAVMQRAADAGGTRPSSTLLQDQLGRVTGADAATRESANAVRQQAQFYQEQYGTNFNGPQALQSIRALRARGYKQLSSGDANQLDIGHANLDIANALEEEMKRNIPVRETAAGITPEAFDQRAIDVVVINRIIPQEVVDGGIARVCELFAVERHVPSPERLMVSNHWPSRSVKPQSTLPGRDAGDEQR